MPNDISSIPISAYDRYAQDVKAITSFVEKYAPLLGERAAIQTAILNLVPQLSSTTVLMQSHLKRSWPTFLMPLTYLTSRSTSSYSVPFLSSNKLVDATIQRIRGLLDTEQENIPPKDADAVKEDAEKLVRACEEIKGNNTMVDFVVSHLLQMLPA